jgi:CDP-4-dehydro-6-deoxyglucose reductase, E1
MSSENKLRKEILGKVKELYKAKKSGEKFTPGKTMIHYSGRVYDEKEMVNLVDSSLDFWLTSGRFAADFEKKLARFLGVKYCMLTNSGSSANLLAVSALTSSKLGKRKLKPGDEVITVACGFPTTLNPILQNNLIPVFVDVELGTYNIDADKIEKAMSKKTKAIFVAHTLGNPVNLDKIMKLAHKHKLWVIEDNCDSLGSKYRGKYTGTFGHLATCSFYPPHHITMGEGGAVITNDPLLKKIVMSFRDWGRDCWCEPGHDDTCGKRFTQKFGELPLGYDHKYVYSHIGYNLKVTDMQAAIGVAQLDKLPGFIKARKNNFKSLVSSLRSHGYDKYLLLPHPEEHSDPSWFGFPILVKKNAHFTRADLVNHLEKSKIATRMLFGGNLTKQPAYIDTKYRIAGGLKNTDTVMNDLFWIGVYPGITKQKMQYIIKTFESFMKGK